MGKLAFLFEQSKMCDHVEEQEMEAEALEAIFDTAFESISSSPPFQWSVKLFPEDGEEGEQSPDNHVGAKLIATIPEEYPECLPLLEVQILKVSCQLQNT